MKKQILGITNRLRPYLKAADRRSIMRNDVAVIGVGLGLAFLINILPLLFFFVAFMFVIANIMQIAIAILIAGIGIVLIRFALKGAGKYMKKFGERKDSYAPTYGDY